MAFSRNLCVRLRFWHFIEALALSSEYSMYSCLSQRSVDPAYRGPVWVCQIVLGRLIRIRWIAFPRFKFGIFDLTLQKISYSRKASREATGILNVAK